MTHPRELRLQIDEGSRDLHGRLIDPAGDQHEFDGWLELLHLLGEAIDLPPPHQAG